MNIFSGLEKIVKKDCSLSNYTWYGLGGNADYVIIPENVEQLTEAVKRCTENSIKIKVLGFGSNLLVRDEGVRGAVIKFDSLEFTRSDFNGTTLTCRSGAPLSKVGQECARKGLSGMEPLTGIPGSIGGAVKMNAGGSFGDIGASVESVTLMDKSGKIFERSKPDLVFDYRSVNITAPIIISARMELCEADTDQILRSIKEIWIYKKNTQPLNTKNSGCIFKNPRGLSAGAIIDRAGLKGTQVGGAKVSEKHANFIEAEKGCRSQDVLKLIDMIREKIKDQYGVDLELELEIW